MTEDEVRCPNCGDVAYWEIDGKSFECMECHNVWEMSEDETMRKYAEAHGCGDREHYVRPLPCVRDEHGEIRRQTVKQLLAKINEELDELKEALFFFSELSIERIAIQGEDELRIPDKETIAEEAADTITAITTMLEALGIDAEMRDEAQRRVNQKNMERGRL